MAKHIEKPAMAYMTVKTAEPASEHAHKGQHRPAEGEGNRSRRVSTLLTEELYLQARKQAFREERSLNEMINDAIKEHLAKYEGSEN